jgi:hypothetical protein
MWRRNEYRKKNRGIGQGIGLKRDSDKENPQCKMRNFEKNRIEAKSNGKTDLTNTQRNQAVKVGYPWGINQKRVCLTGYR